MPLPRTIYEDESLIAFDKPGDLPVVRDREHPERGNLLAMIEERFGDGVVNVHRLDHEASGVFLCAKTKPAQDFLSGQFQAKTAGKVFHALVVVQPAGSPPNRWTRLARGEDGALLDQFSIEASIGPDEVQKDRMRVFKKGGGKESLTEVRVLERSGRFLWLEVRPVTGRPQQIRVHLAAIGAPVLNDASYGDPETKLLLSGLKRGYKGRDEEKPLVARLALHASALSIVHPVTKEPLSLMSPLPSDLEMALRNLRKYSSGAR
jgi:23S rRNA pseudouridine1911/1915/1917 synthase